MISLSHAGFEAQNLLAASSSYFSSILLNLLFKSKIQPLVSCWGKLKGNLLLIFNLLWHDCGPIINWTSIIPTARSCPNHLTTLLENFNGNPFPNVKFYQPWFLSFHYMFFQYSLQIISVVKQSLFDSHTRFDLGLKLNKHITGILTVTRCIYSYCQYH